MRERASGAGKGSRTGGPWGLGLLLGLALVMAPAYGQNPEFNLTQAQQGGGYGLPSENTAMALSVLGSVAAVAIVFSENAWIAVAGLSFAPSLGFMYGGCWGRGMLSAGLRLGATIAMVAVALSNDGPGYALGYGWVGLMAASLVYDLATVRSSVRKHNAAIMARRGPKVGVSPFAMRKGGGVQVSLSF
jgi:hypothetical protein